MQTVDVGFTHVAFTVRCLASSIDFYTRYTAMTVIHQREPGLPSARKVAWLSDRPRPFALVLVQSDDPADTPLGPFGHLGVACATQARRTGMRKSKLPSLPSATRAALAAGQSFAFNARDK